MKKVASLVLSIVLLLGTFSAVNMQVLQMIMTVILMNLVSFRSEKTLVITMLIKIIILLNLVIASQRKFILQTINR